MLHVIALGQYTVAYTRSRAVNGRIARVRPKALAVRSFLGRIIARANGSASAISRAVRESFSRAVTT